MKISGVDIRPGNILEYEGGIWKVAKIQHTQPGKGGAFMQVEMKNLIDGRKTNVRFRSADTVEKVRLDTKDFQYLYAEGDSLVFMDKDSYEQINIDRDVIGDAADFLQDGMDVMLELWEERPISVELPDQVEATYDPFLVKAVLDFVTTDENPVVQRIRAMNVQGDQAFNAKTIWDCFRTMRADFIPLTQQQVGLANMKRTQNRWPYFMSAYYSGITYIIYPIDARLDVDANYVCHPFGFPATSTISEGRPRNPDLSRILSVTDTTGFSYLTGNANQLPDIVPVTQDQYYVFRQGFYAATPTPSSNLEVIALQALQGQAIDLGQLLRLATNAPVWGNLERFYYVPVLIALIKANIGNI